MNGPRHSGKYAPGQGLSLPGKPYRRKPGVPCPEGVCGQARSWWESWATSPYAWEFGPVEWQDLADTCLLMDQFYREGSVRHMAEARQHMAALFGLATRARLHVSVEDRQQPGQAAAARVRRDDPRLRAV